MKCLQYWPEGEIMRFGQFMIRPDSQDIFEQYTIRRIIVEKVKVFRWYQKKYHIEP